MAMNWSKDRERRRMRTRGTEAMGEPDPSFMAPLLRGRRRRPARQPLTKAEQRAEAERLIAEYKARKGDGG